MLHILKEGLLVNLKNDIIVTILRLGDKVFDVLRRVTSGTLRSLGSISEPPLGRGQSSNVLCRNLCREGDILNTPWVVRIGEGNCTCGFHLTNLIVERADVCILKVGKTSKEELGEHSGNRLA